jgi:hypothetical protein
MNRTLSFYLSVLVLVALILSCTQPFSTEIEDPTDGLLADELIVEPDGFVLGVGRTVQFRAIASTADGEVIGGYSIAWESSDNGVLTVSEEGRVTGLSTGNATVSATAEKSNQGSNGHGRDGAPGQLKKRKDIVIDPVVVAAVEVDPGSVTVTAGGGVQLAAIVTDAEGNVLENRLVTWSSSDPAIATVDGQGRVEGLLAGSATIAAQSEGISGTAAITVAPVQIHEFRLVVSGSPDRSNQEQLAGSVLSGDVFVFLLPEEGVDSVRFLLDGGNERWQILAPFDFEGGPADNPNPWNTATVASGQHEIQARVYAAEVTTSVSAVFAVDNDSSEPPPPPSSGLPAFPGAEGYGALALSGMGRGELEVLNVTNLRDSGAGSLRDAIGRSDPGRLSIIVFRTGGTITLSTPIVIDKPNLYIAGQTAPGDGIQLYNNGGKVLSLGRDGRGNNVVIRYVRFRSDKGEAEGQDVISVNGGTDLIFDHVSVQFGNDEVFSFATLPANNSGTDLVRATIQRSIIAVGLRPHSVGSLFADVDDKSTSADFISLHHNLWANNAHRNPRVQGASPIQIINNISYNWRNRAGGMKSGARLDIVGNVLKAGPWTVGSDRNRIFEHDAPPNELSLIFAQGNVAEPFQEDPNADQENLFRFRDLHTSLPAEAFSASRLANPPIPITEQAAAVAYTNVLDDVGANARLDCSGEWVMAIDPLDQLILDQVRQGTGPSTDEENDHPSDYGGVPILSQGTACTDSDADGMPDAFETRFGLNPNSPSDASQDADGDGYTNLEEFLNGTDPR